MKLLISKSELKNTKVYRWVADICNTSFVAKVLVLIIIWGVALIPVDLFLLLRWIIGPEGFWQELALIVAVAIAIGWLQAILIFIAIVLSITVISEGI